MRQTKEELAAKKRARYLANHEENKKRARERYEALPTEERREKNLRYYEANRAKISERRKEYRKTLDRTKYKGADRDLHLRRKYGIGQTDYERMLELQGGRCAICGTTDPKGKGNVFHVDHCHKTGLVRGLLCKPCNTALGYVEDSVDTLMAMAAYVLVGTDVLLAEGVGQNQ